jgi:hypothetical protein
MDIDARAFGQLEGEVKTLTKLLEDQAATLLLLQTQLAAVQTTLSEAKGGWRTLMWLAGIGAMSGSAVTWVLSHWKP